MKLKNMNLKDLAAWLDEYGQFDGSPWMEWFGSTYCDKCESIKCKYTDAKEKLGISPLSYSGEVDCAYCELNDHCKFFPQIKGIPDNKEVIKMWLNEEADHDGKSNDSKSVN
jgi:hypothetical protein